MKNNMVYTNKEQYQISRLQMELQKKGEQLFKYIPKLFLNFFSYFPLF